LPELQSQILRNVAFGVIESVKTASDLIGPLNGVITEINSIIQKLPEAINDQPYKNWICKIYSLDDLTNKELFLDASRYNELIS
jgi:glycine cleavage system H protein